MLLNLILWLGLLALVVVVIIFNRLVRLRNLAQEGWSGINVQLKRRADLIPNLVETVRGYAGHERDVLEKVSQSRAQTVQANSPEERARAENALSGALVNLLAVAENYPDLKASKNFQDLQAALSNTEDQIQLARRYYNGTVRNLNISVQSFPANIVAGVFHFGALQYFQLDDPEDRAVPNVAVT